MLGRPSFQCSSSKVSDDGDDSMNGRSAGLVSWNKLTKEYEGRDERGCVLAASKSKDIVIAELEARGLMVLNIDESQFVLDMNSYGGD